MSTSLNRRRFLTAFSAAGVSSTLLPGVLWARMQEQGAEKVTMAMLNDALAIAGLDFSEEDRKQILNTLNPNGTTSCARWRSRPQSPLRCITARSCPGRGSIARPALFAWQSHHR